MSTWRRVEADLRRGPAGALLELFDDGGLQRSAAISFYAFLSLFPLAILTVAVFGVVVSDAEARSRVTETIMSALPLREDRGRRELRQVLEQVTAGATGFGVVGIAGLVVSASGAMGAIRQGLNAVFEVAETRPVLLGKAMDLLLMCVAGATILASVGVTVVVRTATGLLVGVPGSAALPVVVIGVLSAGVVALLYGVVPNTRVAWPGIWRGAVLVAAGFELLKWGFSFYVSHAARYSAVYDSLATAAAFLVFLYLASALLLLGGEVAARHTRGARSRHEADERRAAAGGRGSARA